MCMITWLFYWISSYGFIIVVSFWIFSHHSSIESRHKFLIFTTRMVACSIFSHHISNSSRFSYPEVLYMFISFSISCFYLSYDR